MTVILTIFIALSSAATAATTHRQSNEELIHEKRGRIIDGDTGAGVPGAQVIPVWGQSGFGWSGSGGGCNLQKFVITDKSGGYVIPSVAEELDLSHRRAQLAKPELSADSSWLEFSWNIVVYLPGYIREGDAEAFDRSPNGLSAKASPDLDAAISRPELVQFDWLQVEPAIDSVGKLVQLKPIRMFKKQLEPLHEIVYDYWIIRSINNCHGIAPPPIELKAIQQDIQRGIEMLPCKLSENTMVPGEIVSDYEFILFNKAISLRLRKTNKDRYSHPYHDMTAGALCEIATAARTEG